MIAPSAGERIRAGPVDFAVYLADSAERSATDQAVASAFGGWRAGLAGAGKSLPSVSGIVEGAEHIVAEVLAFEDVALPDPLAFV